MKKILYTGLIVLSLSSCNNKEIDIVDTNFKNALLTTNCIDTDNDGKEDSNVDLNKDGIIQLEEIESVELLNVSSQNIKSLKGIEYFKNLKRLDCYKNELSNLDISKNKNLEVLYCYDNLLTKLDVSKNEKLQKFGCRGNKLTTLDLSKNKQLVALYCYKNQLTSLNIKNGNNTNLKSLSANDNPNLKCILVDNENNSFPKCDDSGYGGWCKDVTAEYQENCD